MKPLPLLVPPEAPDLASIPAASKPGRRRVSSLLRRAGGLSATTVGERVSAFLRARHPVKPAENVAAEVPGLKARTVAKLLERRSAPSAVTFVLLLCAYGPEFLRAAVPETVALPWLDRDVREAEARRLDAEIEALRARRARIAA